MEKKIQKLYKEIRDIAAWYMIYQRRDNVEQIRKIIPRIQEFVLWFLEGNRFGIEEDLYREMSINLNDILKDILTALEQRDMVLMHDAIAYGVLEYLKLFVDPEQEETE